MSRWLRLLGPVLALGVGCTTLGARGPALDLPPPGELAAPSAPDLSGRTRIELGELLDLASAHHPRLQAVRARVGVAEGRRRQAAIYPNPVLRLSADEVPSEHLGLHRSENMAGLTIPLVVSGRLGAAEAVGAAAAAAAQADAAVTERSVRAGVRAVVTDALYLEAARDLLAELADLTEGTAAEARALAAAQAAPEVEQAKAELAALDLDVARRDVAARRQALPARLGAAVGLDVPPASVSGSLAVPPALSLVALEAALARGHPALAAAGARVDAARRELDRLEAARVPDLGLRLAGGRHTGQDEGRAAAGLSVELPFFDRSQGSIQAQEYRIAELERRAAALERDLRAELAGAYAAEAAARARAVRYAERVLPAAARSLEQARAGYRAGKLPFLDVLDAQRTLVRSRTLHLEALRDLHRARARLHGVLGDDLPDPLP